MPEGGLPAPDPAARWAPPRSVFKVVVVGAPGVGKTSLVRLLLGAPAGAASRGAPRACDLAAGAGHPGHDGGPEPTVGADFCTRAVFLDGTARPVRLHLWDTSGQERFRSVVEPCITGLEDHDAIVVVYDTSASESLEEANALIVRARRLAAGSPQVALVGCKCDRGPREVSTGEGRARAAELGAAVFAEASCPPATGSQQVDRLPGEALSTHTEAEEKLVRPLLRRCREAAGPTTAPLPPAPAPALEPQCRAAARQQHPRCSVLRCLGLA